HYNFSRKATATDVVERLLNEFGLHLCPGPDDKPFAYISDQAQCKAHAVTMKVGTHDVSLFTLLQKYYPPNDDRLSLYRALTIASISMREIPNDDLDPANANAKSDIQGVVSVYYNRYQHGLGNPKYPSDTGSNLEADPTVQYAVTTLKAPTNGKWWPNLNAVDLKTVAVTSRYNTYLFPGLPPGPISAPFDKVLLAAANPVAVDGKLYYYFINAKCPTHKPYFATNIQAHDALAARYITNAKCS